jgi:hypothetical protein
MQIVRTIRGRKMSVLDELKALEQSVRATLGKSFNYGFLCAMFGFFAFYDWVALIFGNLSLLKIIEVAVETGLFIYFIIKQHLYATDKFNETLAHAHDPKPEFKGDKVEHL